MKNIVLVTGATGFIGRHVIAALKSFKVVVHSVSRASVSMPNVINHSVDLFSAADTQALLKKIKPTHLIHCAWFTKPGEYWESPLNQDWLNASINLARCFAAINGQRFIGIGSCAEYDWTLPSDQPWQEVRPLNPHSFYGQCKVALYRELDPLFAKENVSFGWARLFYPFGPYEPPERLTSVICRALFANKPALLSSGRQIRDFIPAQEVGRAIASLAHANLTGAINIGSGEGISVADLALKIAKLLNKEDLIHLGAIPSRSNEPSSIVADITRLKNELNFFPSKDSSAYLLELIAWIKKTQLSIH